MSDGSGYIMIGPQVNERLLSVGTAGLLDADQVSLALRAAEGASWRSESGGIWPEVADADGPLIDGLLPLLCRAIETANDSIFRFDLLGVLSRDPVHFARIGPASHDLCHDLRADRSNRKLLLVVALSTGVFLDRSGSENVIELGPGEAGVLPSFLPIRPRSPEEQAIVLVARALGPAFR